MYNEGRRKAFRILGSGLFVATASSLGAKTADATTVTGVCEVTEKKDGSLLIESAKRGE